PGGRPECDWCGSMWLGRWGEGASRNAPADDGRLMPCCPGCFLEWLLWKTSDSAFGWLGSSRGFQRLRKIALEVKADAAQAVGVDLAGAAGRCLATRADHGGRERAPR
ncbi:MAG: hypothetical protein BJG00_007030, partial [Limnothrix sp. CACIAM 69d]